MIDVGWKIRPWVVFYEWLFEQSSITRIASNNNKPQFKGLLFYYLFCIIPEVFVVLFVMHTVFM